MTTKTETVTTISKKKTTKKGTKGAYAKRSDGAAEWASVRVRANTILRLKKLTIAYRKNDAGATLDSVLSAALGEFQAAKGISDATVSATRLPVDGRAAGAQARSARVSVGEES